VQTAACAARSHRGDAMKGSRSLIVLSVALVLLILPAPAASGPTPSFDQAIDQLVAQGYPQAIEAHLCGLGTSPLGFRVGGTSSDNAAAYYVAGQMAMLGLKNVRLEPVKMDVWEFHSASVTVGDRVFQASSFTGVPGTPADGVTGEVVYVGGGTAAEFEEAGSVVGKIVLVDFLSDSWWSNMPSHEAALRGATAIILTSSRADLNYYADPDTLGSNDGEHDLAWPSLVHVSRTDGDWLEQKIAAGPVVATVKLDATIRRASQGGRGYNVVGELPGSSKSGQSIVLCGHRDCFFRSAVDDTSAVVAELAIAKAMKMAAVKPRRTLVFMATTGEEFGIVDSWYDWCFGSWYSATTTHTDWPGKVAGFLNMEGPGCIDGQIKLFTGAESVPYLQQIIDDNPKLRGPNQTALLTPPDCGFDQWPFHAAGIPSVTLKGRPLSWNPWYAHCQNDTIDTVDWPYFGTCAKFMYRMVEAVDQPVPPYSLVARADEIAGLVDAGELVAAGADRAVVARLTDALAAFDAAATAYDARRDDIPAATQGAASRKLLEVEKRLNSNFTALSWWDDTTYPHEQVLWDLEGVSAAVGNLQHPNPQQGQALRALDEVGYTWYGTNFSPAVYYHELDRHDPDYWGISWAGQGHLPQPIDVMPEYWQIQAGDYSGALTGLLAEQDRQKTELDRRLADMAAVLEPLPAMVDGIR
jgi:Iap family predicted aminopeptidase